VARRKKDVGVPGEKDVSRFCAEANLFGKKPELTRGRGGVVRKNRVNS